MPPEIIVSMTSYPARISTVHLAVESLLQQTMRADRIILWLADTQFPDGFDSLPEPLRRQTERGLTIRRCDDLGSYKRQYFAFKEFPDAAIVIVDDDLIYPPDMIETLSRSFKKHPDAVSAMRTHFIRFEQDGSLAPYSSWYYEYSGLVDVPSMTLYATPGGGTLVPPGAMHEATLDLENLKICPTADDIWMKLMYTLTNTPVVLAAENRPLIEIPETQEQALWRVNSVQCERDKQCAALLEKYNKTYGENDTLVSRMRRDAKLPERNNPMLTVICLPDIDGHITDLSLQSVVSQDFDDMEIIIPFDADTSDSRVRNVHSDGGLMSALSAAALTSKGDYVLTLLPGERLLPGACQRLMERVRSVETNPARLSYDIFDTSPCIKSDTLGAAVCGGMAWDLPDSVLSGKLFRGSLWRLTFRFINLERFSEAHPAAAVFIAAVCAKKCCASSVNVVSRSSCKLSGNAQAVRCAAEFLSITGGEEAFGQPFGRLCIGLCGEDSAIGAVGAAMENALLKAEERRNSLKAQLTEAANALKNSRNISEKQSQSYSIANKQVRKLEKQLDELYDSSIYKVGRTVTWLPRKMKRLIYRLLGKS